MRGGERRRVERGWVRAAMAGLHGGGIGRASHSGEETGRQIKTAPHSARAKWLEGQGACVCMGEATDTPLCPFVGERPQNTCLRQGRKGAAEVGQAPPALRETLVARWRVALSVLPTPSHPEDAPSCSGGGTSAAGWLPLEDVAP